LGHPRTFPPAPKKVKYPHNLLFIRNKITTFAKTDKLRETMCTYNISIDDALMERVRPAFADNTAIGKWMQSQVEILLLQMVGNMEQPRQETSITQQLRGIAKAPADFDYKKELANRYFE
jgi:hypothetical protein